MLRSASEPLIPAPEDPWETTTQDDIVATPWMTFDAGDDEMDDFDDEDFDDDFDDDFEEELDDEYEDLDDDPLGGHGDKDLEESEIGEEEFAGDFGEDGDFAAADPETSPSGEDEEESFDDE